MIDATDWTLRACRAALAGVPIDLYEPLDYPDVEWRDAAAIVVTTRMAGLLGCAQHERLISAPDGIAETMLGAHAFNTSRNRLLSDQLVDLASELPSDARVLARKGIHLASL